MQSVCGPVFVAFRLAVVGVCLALFSFCGKGVFAAPYPDEAQLREAIAAVAGLVRNEGLEVRILDAQKYGVSRPLMAAGLSVARGVCMVFYNSRPSSLLAPFFERMSGADLPVWLRAVAVHEVSHCVEQREGYVLGRFDRVLPPGFTRDGMTGAGYAAALRSGAMELWGEALADIAALLWLQQARPGDWRRFAGGLVALRDELAARNPSHNTAPWLRGIIDGGAAPDGERGIFETAFRLRRELRPD